MILSQIFLSCICIGFLSSTLIYNTGCLPKMYTRLYTEDDKIFDNGSLEEIQVAGRAECFPLCDRTKDCNLVLYNSVTSVCRLYDYTHYNITETASTQIGWQYYGVGCNQSNCFDSSLISTNRCSSCLHGNVWTYDGVCVLYRSSHDNPTVSSIDMVLPLGLTTGMILMVRVSKYDPGSWTLFTLTNTPVFNYDVGTEIFPEDDIVNTFSDTESTSAFAGTFPVVNTSDFSVAVHIKSDTMQMFMDGTPIKTFPKPPALLDNILLEGVNFYTVQIMRSPVYCS